MSGSGRRRGSKWDMKEDFSPENHHDVSRSNNTGSSFHEHESRDYMSGRRGFQRDDRMNEESMLGGGHYSRRMSPGPDGRRPQSRSRSPRRSRGRSYRSRSKSRSRSRSPAHNLQREPGGHRSSSKSGHSAPLCRDFASGRCKKRDHCRFAHHSSPNHDSRRHFEIKSGDGWESRRGNDGASRHHSDPYSGGRSTYICNDFLKGRCTRGASCKFRHQDAGSDEFAEGASDGSYRGGGYDWRSKSGSSYDREAHVSSEPLCKFFAAGNCRNGKHCKVSHQREGQFNSERGSPVGRQPEHNLEGMNRIWNDSNWVDRNSLRRVPEASEWEVEGSDFRDGRRSVHGEWSKEGLLNHELGDPTYMRGAASSGNEKMASKENQSLQWKSNGISVSETKAIEKGFVDRKMLSPKGTFNSQMGLVGQRSDLLAFPQTSLSFGEQDTTQRASAENHYLSGIIQPNICSDYSQPNPSFPMNIAAGARNNGPSYVNINILADIPHGQGVRQDGGLVAQPISSVGNVGQPNPSFPVDIAAGARNNVTSDVSGSVLADIPRGQGIRQDGGLVAQPISTVGNVGQPNPSTPVDIATGARNNVTSHVNVNILTDIPRGQSIRQDGVLVAQPISTLGSVGQSQSTFPLHPPGGEHIQIAHYRPVLDATLAMGQSQSMFPPYNPNQGMQMPHHQPVVDSNPVDGAYVSNTGISQAASGVALSQNSVLNEQLAQYSHLSATLVQLLEKRQLPQLHAAITQQNTSVPPVAAAFAEPILASEPTRQYDPINDSFETKVAGSLVEQSSQLTVSEIPSLNFNPPSFATDGMMATGDPKIGSNGDELQHKDHHLNVQGPAVFSKEENGEATGKGANETVEALDQGPTDEIALDSGADDGKKAKDTKGVRQFKFALAEYVKELLKPTWKGGQMSKEVYKTIVKKVVDKVTETIQPANIPRTKEKIDQYLSLSKPKLSKLIQAYLEKYHKT